MTDDRRGGVPVLVLVTALWAVSFPLVGGVVGKDPGENEFVFLSLRFVLATLAFLPILPIVIRQGTGRGLQPWFHGAIIGTMLFFGYWTQTVGLKYTTPSRSAFVTMLSVPMVPIFAALVHRRRPSLVHLVGSAIAVAGVGIVLAPEGTLEPNRGDYWTLACAFVFAVEILVIARFARQSGAAVLAVAQIATVAVLSLVGWKLSSGTMPELTHDFWVAVVVTGILCTTLAIGGMTWAQGRISAETAAMVFALEPVFAGLFEYIYLDRGMNRLQWGGGLVVVFAVAWTSRAPAPGDPPGPSASAAVR